ncbi:MAG: BPSS1780 family membrane protein, partial [Rhizobacter sp.]
MDEGNSVAAGEPRGVDPGRGIAWWTDSWALFMKNAVMWLVFGVLMLVIFFVLNFIPFIGWLAGSLLTPVFVGGWMLAARKTEGGAALEIGDLFAGFNQNLTPLVILGALLLVGVIIIGAVVSALGFGAAMGMMMGGSHRSGVGVGAAMFTGMLAMLVTLVLGALIAMAFWFAPALVVFRNVQPFDAMKASFFANLKNIGAFLLYGVLYIVLA